MRIVQLRQWPFTQILTRYENFSLSEFPSSFFFYSGMNVKPSAVQQLEKYAGRRRPQINYGLRLLLFFFNLLQRVCLASLRTASVLFLTQCWFPPHRSPSPCCHRQEGSEDKRRAATPGWHTHCTSKEKRKIQMNLHNAPFLTLCLQLPAETLLATYKAAVELNEPATLVWRNPFWHHIRLICWFSVVFCKAREKLSFLSEILRTYY